MPAAAWSPAGAAAGVPRSLDRRSNAAGGSEERQQPLQRPGAERWHLHRPIGAAGLPLAASQRAIAAQEQRGTARRRAGCPTHQPAGCRRSPAATPPGAALALPLQEHLARMVQIGKKAAAGPKKGKKALTFTIDCSKPVEDKVRLLGGCWMEGGASVVPRAAASVPCAWKAAFCWPAVLAWCRQGVPVAAAVAVELGEPGGQHRRRRAEAGSWSMQSGGEQLPRHCGLRRRQLAGWCGPSKAAAWTGAAARAAAPLAEPAQSARPCCCIFCRSPHCQAAAACCLTPPALPHRYLFRSWRLRPLRSS